MLSGALLFSGLALAVWLAVVLLPWQPWRNREVLEAGSESVLLDDVTVVIPARNEADVLPSTLAALKQQGEGLKIIVVDDDSEDGTAAIAKQAGLVGVTVIESKALPVGWTGKLWAQHQGLNAVDSEFVLLLDADIALAPGMLAALKRRLSENRLQFISLMAQLRFESFWEKLLMPAFIFFFKMIYPFALSNRPSSKVAAAAGGCILLETQALEKVGGVQVIRDAIIDDCSLADQFKKAGFRTWIGLSHGVVSQRPYGSLADIWQMVARTAYTQLNYSVALLLGCTVLMLLMFWWPVFGMLFMPDSLLAPNMVAFVIMCSVYLPTLTYYRLNPGLAIFLPLVALLYLLMTWHSAVRYWRGEKSRWKGRSYQKSA